MNKVIKDHIALGYISKVEYTEVRESGRETDFVIRYYPGNGAKESTKRIRSRIGKKTIEQPEALLPTEQTQSVAQKKAPTSAIPKPRINGEQDELIQRLLEHGVHTSTATKLVSTEPEEVRRQLEYLPYRTVKKNKGGLLRDAILGRWTPPDEYLEFKKKQFEQEESQERLKRKKAEEAEAAARQKHEEELKRAYFDYLKGREAQLQKDKPKSYSHFLKDTAAKRSAVEIDPAHKGAAKKIFLRLFDDEESHLERLREFFKESTFEEWREQNLNRVQP